MEKETVTSTEKSDLVSPRKLDPHDLLERFTALMSQIIEDAKAADSNIKKVLAKIEEKES